MNLLDLMVKVGVDDQASGKIDTLGGSIKSKLGSAAAAGAKAIGAAVAAAGAGAIALGKTALDAYASYEQLAGGVEKLFGDANTIVMAHAQEAYRTTGMSANQYMEQVTSFSAALINSLGGDTAAAAEQADVAMRAISDNVNVFGSDMESVQMAFQGFAKQNYTMLDNLRLGYGGTKTEMERLIDDANAYAASIGQASDLSIDSFSDIVTAIELIQEKQGIAGTTAKEAGRTIEGSINSVKAAWSNLLAEIGKPDADIGARMSELVTSVFGDGTENNLGVFGNVMPAVQRIVEGMATALQTAMPYIQQAIQTYLPAVVDAIVQMIPPLLSVILEVVVALANELPDILMLLIPAVLQILPQLVDAALTLVIALADALAENSSMLINTVVDVIFAIVDVMIDHVPELLEAAAVLVFALVEAIALRAPEILYKLAEVVVDMIGAVLDGVGRMLSAGAEFVGAILTAIVENAPRLLDEMIQTIANIIGTVAGAWSDMNRAAREWFMGLLDGAGDSVSSFLGWVGNIPRNILNALGNLGNLLWNAGASIIDGLWDGMASAARGLFDWVGGIAGTIASLKGPLPYDRTVLVENGLALMKGLRTGIQDSFEKDIIPYISDMADRMGDAFGSPELGVSTGMPDVTAGGTAAVGGVLVTGNEFIVRDEEDIPKIAEQISRLWQRQMDGALA